MSFSVNPGQVVYQNVQGKQFLSYENDDKPKCSGTEEEAELSGVPVRKIREVLVRDRAFKT